MFSTRINTQTPLCVNSFVVREMNRKHRIERVRLLKGMIIKFLSKHDQ